MATATKTKTTTEAQAPVGKGELVVVDKPKLPPLALSQGNRVQAILPQNLEEAYRVATVAFKGGICPKDCTSVENAMVRVLHGMEVGLMPMAAIQSIAVINGRPTIWGDGAIALVRASGLCVYIKEFEEERTGSDGKKVLTAVCSTLRVGESEPTERTWSEEDERVSGLATRDIHRAYPKRMRQMRARAFCLRDTYADVLKGLGIREEVEDYSDNKTIEHAPPPSEDVVDAATQPVVEVSQSEQPGVKHTHVEGIVGEVVANPTSPAPSAEPTKQPTTAAKSVEQDQAAEAEQRDAVEWLRELEGAFSGCESPSEAFEVMRDVMLPMEKKVSAEDWAKACLIRNEHRERCIARQEAEDKKEAAADDDDIPFDEPPPPEE